jgi:hypothetical protein
VVDDRILLKKNHKLDGSPVYADEQEWTKRQIPGPADSCAPEGADATISFTDRMGRIIYRRRNAPAAVIAQDKKAVGQPGGLLPSSPTASVAHVVAPHVVAASVTPVVPAEVPAVNVSTPAVPAIPKPAAKNDTKPAASANATTTTVEAETPAPAAAPKPAAASNTTEAAPVAAPKNVNATAETKRRSAHRKAEMSARHAKKAKKQMKRRVAEKAEEDNTLPTVEVLDDQVNPSSDIDAWGTWDDRDHSAAYSKYLKGQQPNGTVPVERAHGMPANLQRGIKSGRQVAKIPSAKAVIMQQQDFHDEIVNYGPVEHERGPLPSEQTDMWFNDPTMTPEQHSTVLPHEQRWNRAPHDNEYVPATHYRSSSSRPSPSGPNEQYHLEQAKVITPPTGRGMAINETGVTVSKN